MRAFSFKGLKEEGIFWMNILRMLPGKIKRLLGIITAVHRGKATDIIAFELTERENIFMVLLLGSLIGLPSPPTIFSLELLPLLEKELEVMVARNDLSQDPLGALMGMLNID